MAEEPGWPGEMGRIWAGVADAMDRQLAGVGEALLSRLAPCPGERVIDLGCGGGATVLGVAEAVGPGGRVTGLDVSPDLAALARARTAHLPQVEILETDAARHPLPPGSHDALVSRHGCMFFEDPAAAFAALRRALRAEGRIALSAFAAPGENEWARIPGEAAARVLGPAEPPAPGTPGPFAWAEPETFRAPLAAAGFRDIAWEARDVSFPLGAGDDPDPVERACDLVLTLGVVARRAREAGGDAKERLRPALRDALAPHVRDGWVRLGARIWLVTARA